MHPELETLPKQPPLVQHVARLLLCGLPQTTHRWGATFPLYRYLNDPGRANYIVRAYLSLSKEYTFCKWRIRLVQVGSTQHLSDLHLTYYTCSIYVT